MTATRLAGERIYYDRATVLRQLGVLHEPDTVAGRVSTAITHPVTLGKALIARVVGGTDGGAQRDSDQT